MGIWENDAEECSISIDVHMPSGTCVNRKDHDVQVFTDSRFFETAVRWLEVLMDTGFPHNSWIDSAPKFHLDIPRALSLRAFLPLFRTSEYLYRSR